MRLYASFSRFALLCLYLALPVNCRFFLESWVLLPIDDFALTGAFFSPSAAAGLFYLAYFLFTICVFFAPFGMFFIFNLIRLILIHF